MEDNIVFIERNDDILQMIPLYGGYSGEKFWEQDENRSAFYSVYLDEQGNIPIDGVDEYMEQFIKAHNL